MKPRAIWLSMCLAGVVLAGVALPRAQNLGPVKMDSYDYDMAKVVLPPQLSETELKGRHLYALRCLPCHTGTANAYAPRLDQERVKVLGDEAVRTKIAMGSQRMPGFRYMFEPPQVDLIVAYLKSMPPPDKKP